jgi:DNA-binding beta-propeller fold protein YncE
VKPIQISSALILTLFSGILGAQPYGYVSSASVPNYFQTISFQGKPPVSASWGGVPSGDEDTFEALIVNAAGTVEYSLGYSCSPQCGAYTLLVNSLADGSLLASVGSPVAIYSAIFSRDQQNLYIVGLSDNCGWTVSLFAISTNTFSSTVCLTGNNSNESLPAYTLALSLDGSTLYIAAGNLIIFDTQTLTETQIQNEGEATTLALSPDGSRLWLLSLTGFTVVDTQTLATISSIKQQFYGTFNPGQLIYSQDGNNVIAVITTGVSETPENLFDYDANTFQLVNSGTFDLITAISVPGPNSTFYVLQEGADRIVQLSYPSFSTLAKYPLVENALSFLALPEDAGFIVYYYDPTAILVFDAASTTFTGKALAGASSSCAAPGPSGSEVYFANELSANLTALNKTTNQVAAVLEDVAHLKKAAISPDGTRAYLLSLDNEFGSDAGSVTIVDLATKKVIQTFTSSANYFLDFALSPDGNTLYVASAIHRAHADPAAVGLTMPSTAVNCPGTNGLCVFDTSSFALLAQIPEASGPHLSISQSGRSLYVAGGLAGFLTVDTAAYTVTKTTLPQSYAESFILDPNAEVALMLPAGLLFNTASNTIGGSFPIPSGIASAAFTPQGDQIWFSTDDSSGSYLVGETFPAGGLISKVPARTAGCLVFVP